MRDDYDFRLLSIAGMAIILISQQTESMLLFFMLGASYAFSWYLDWKNQ